MIEMPYIIAASVLLLLVRQTAEEVTYVIQADQRLYNNTIVVVDATLHPPIHFTCSVDARDASFEWYINNNLLSYQDSQLGVTASSPYVVNASLRIGTLEVPSVSYYNMAAVKCGASVGSGGPYSQSLVMGLVYDPPTLVQQDVKLVQLTPHTLQFSWEGPLDDFVDYFIVTIQNGIDVLTFNTTELQANLTSTCGVTYKCSVVPVNVVGQGNVLAANYTSPSCLTIASSPSAVSAATDSSDHESPSSTTSIAHALPQVRMGLMLNILIVLFST